MMYLYDLAAHDTVQNFQTGNYVPPVPREGVGPARAIKCMDAHRRDGSIRRRIGTIVRRTGAPPGMAADESAGYD